MYNLYRTCCVPLTDLIETKQLVKIVLAPTISVLAAMGLGRSARGIRMCCNGNMLRLGDHHHHHHHQNDVLRLVEGICMYIQY